MKSACIFLADDTSFALQFKSHFEENFSDFGLFHWRKLNDPISNKLLAGKGVMIRAVILDESLMNFENLDQIRDQVDAILRQFPSCELFYFFNMSWKFFIELYNHAIPVPSSLSLDFISIHLNGILRGFRNPSHFTVPDNTTILTSGNDSTKQHSSDQPTPTAVVSDKAAPPGLISDDGAKTVQADLKNLVKSILYKLLPEIEEKHVHLKISIPDKDIVAVVDRNGLSQFLSSHMHFLLKELSHENYSFIEVKLESGSNQSRIKLIHTEIAEKSSDGLPSFVSLCGPSNTVMEFSNELPKQEDTASSEAKVQSEVELRQILVIEDETIMLEMISSIFETQGFEVKAAQTPKAALDFISAQTFDLILTDINLPGMTGFEIIEIIRQDPKNQGTKVVAMTGLMTKLTMQKIQELSLSGFLTKPFTIEKLIQTVRELLD